MLNCELWTVSCLLTFRHRPLPTAYCPCLLRLREAGWRGLLAGVAALDKMSPPTGKGRTSNVENRTSNAGKSMKTKDRCGKLGCQAGMSMKTKELRVKGGNVVENKGRRWQAVGGRRGRKNRGWVLGKNSRQWAEGGNK